MRRKAKSTIQRAYTRERNRVRNLINRYRKAGFDVQIDLPSIPKKVTAGSVRRLQRITPKKVQEKTYGVDYETGEQLSYQKARRYYNARKKASKQASTPQQIAINLDLPSITEIVTSNWLELVEHYPDKARDAAKDWYNNMLAKTTPDELAEVLEAGRENGDWLEPRESYDLSKVYDALADMTRLLGLSADEQKEILSEIEEWEEY